MRTIAEANPDRSGELKILLELLDLEELEQDRFRGHHPEHAGMGSRTFGGQLMSQALIAAGRTVDGTQIPASLSAHFIRGGNTSEPIEYSVNRLRDGRNLTNREVTAWQGDQELSVFLVAFAKPSPGLEHQPTMPEVPAPETLPTLGEALVGYEDAVPEFVEALRPIDMRYAVGPSWVRHEEPLEVNRVWMRADGELPEDPLLNAAVLAYGSDTTLLDSIVTSHGLAWGQDRFVAATINHTTWFFHPLRFDRWTLYASSSPVAGNGRALATGRFFAADGTIIASTAQEAVIRHFPPRSPRD